MKDFFNNTQELVGGSFLVKKVNFDTNGNESGNEPVDSGNYIITKKSDGDRNGFEFQFKGDINSAYKIVYKTKAIVRIFDSEKITNQVEEGGKTATGTRNIYQQIL